MTEDSKEYGLYSQIINDIYACVPADEASNIADKLSELISCMEVKYTTGAVLIAIERNEHIDKHHRTIEHDIEYNSEGQLLLGASILIAPDGTLGTTEYEMLCPDGWDPKIWEKMWKKELKDRKIIAGSLIAADIDMNLRIALCTGKG